MALQNIYDIAKKAGINEQYVEPYGKHKAKILKKEHFSFISVYIFYFNYYLIFTKANFFNLDFFNMLVSA